MRTRLALIFLLGAALGAVAAGVLTWPRGVEVPHAVAERISPEDIVPALPPGMVAVSVRIGWDTGGAAFIKADDVVDALLTREVEGRLVTSIIARDVVVLAVDPGAQHPPDPQPDSPEPASAIVTIAAIPADAQRLTLAAQVGELSLVFRRDVFPLDSCSPWPDPPPPRWLLYPDGHGSEGRGRCALKLPGVNERPFPPVLRRRHPLQMRAVDPAGE